MKKIITAVMGTISGLVLLFSYHTSTNAEATTSPSTDTGTGTNEATAPSTPNSAESTAPSPSASESASESATDTSGGSSESGTYTGDEVETEWGVVQVQITVENGKITAAEAIEYPDENPKDQRINAYALPILSSEVLDAQSADIDAVSGATVTSDGYTESLQSALDAAHLG
ncbi:MAG TPA: FMN-binding protein [Propionicimonas sp.]|nr:FMN-binding protein [Propionicimonas sp.]